jgi:hypothetical protein
VGNTAGAIPKPDGQKVHRNPVAFDWTLLPAAGRAGRPPKLPTGLRDWTKATRAAWADLWSSPQATAWDQSGRTLHTWAALHHDLVMDERATASISAEMRQHEDRHGLNPAALLRLRWRIIDLPDEATMHAPQQSSSQNRGRLVAIR